MRVAYISSPAPQAEDMLADSLLSGLVTVLGADNVHEWWGHLRYSSNPQYLRDWPVYLGALAYPASVVTLKTDVLSSYDYVFLSTSALGRVDLAGVGMRKIVFINGSDVAGERPKSWYPPRLVLHRVGCEWSGWPCMRVHISSPWAWRSHQLTTGLQKYNEVEETKVYAAWSDNSAERRAVMEALSAAKFNGALLRWGSAAKHAIPGTAVTTNATRYMVEMQRANVVVGCRGGSPDCLRQWEALAMGKVLVSDFFGCDEFTEGIHYLHYDTPGECVRQIRWAMNNPEEAALVARRGKRLYEFRHTPEAQAKRVVEKLKK